MLLLLKITENKKIYMHYLDINTKVKTLFKIEWSSYNKKQRNSRNTEKNV